MSNTVLSNHVETMVFEFSEIRMAGGNGTNGNNPEDNNDTNPSDKSVVSSFQNVWKTTKPSLGAVYKRIGNGVSRASGNLIRLGTEAIDQAGKFNEILSIHDKPEDQLDIKEQLSCICRERKRDKDNVESLFEEAFQEVRSDTKYAGIDLDDLKHKIFREC